MLDYLPTCMTRALLRLAVPRNLLRLIVSILLVHGMFCLAIAAQPEAAALCCVPWLFSAALVWAFAVGAEPLLLLLTAGMSALGISLQLSLGELPSRLKLLYLLGFAAAAAAAALLPLLCRHPSSVLTASLALSTVLTILLRLAPAVNGSHLSFQIAGISVQPIELIKVFSILAQAAVLSDTHHPSPSRSAFAVLLFFAACFTVLNEFGTLLVVLCTTCVMLIVELPFREYAGWIIGCVVLGAAAYAICRFAAGLSDPGLLALPARIYSKLSNRFIYTGIISTSNLDDTSGAGYQASQAYHMLLLSDVWSRSPWNIHLPVVRSDLILCWLMHEYGLASVYLLAAALFVFFVVTTTSSYRSLGFMSILGLGSGCCVVIAALINMLGASGLMPLTGLPLPFVSSGGSNLVASFILLSFALKSTIRNPNQTFEGY